MSHIRHIFTYEFWRNFRRKGYLFTTFGIPLLAFVIALGYQGISSLNSGQGGSREEQTRLAEMFRGIQKAGYVDLSGQFPQPGSRLAAVLTRYPDKAAAQAALQSGAIDVYYVIAADYLQTGNLTLVMPHLSLNQISPQPIEELVFNNLGSTVSPALLARLRNPAVIQEVNVQRETPQGTAAPDEGTQFGTVYLFAILFLMSVFLTNGYLMQSVIEEKETRLIEILVSTVRPAHLLMGKILALGSLGLLQIATWLVSVVLLLRLVVQLPALATTFLPNIFLPTEFLPLFLIYFVLGYLFFAAAFGAIGAISNSLQEGPQYAVVFTLPAALPFYFFSMFVSTPDATAPVLMSLFPITAPLAMVMRVVASAVPAWQIMLSMVLLALADIGMIWLAGRLFRVNTLLAGQLPKLRDIPRLLRG